METENRKKFEWKGDWHPCGAGLAGSRTRHLGRTRKTLRAQWWHDWNRIDRDIGVFPTSFLASDVRSIRLIGRWKGWASAVVMKYPSTSSHLNWHTSRRNYTHSTRESRSDGAFHRPRYSQRADFSQVCNSHRANASCRPPFCPPLPQNRWSCPNSCAFRAHLQPAKSYSQTDF